MFEVKEIRCNPVDHARFEPVRVASEVSGSYLEAVISRKIGVSTGVKTNVLPR